MKKGIKVVLGIGIACCVFGAVFAGVGIATGGTKYVKAADLNHTHTSDNQESTLEKTVLDSFDSLHVSMEADDLNIVTSDDDHYYISYRVKSSSNNSSIYYGVENGKLVVQDECEDDEYVVDISFLSQLFGSKGSSQSTNQVTIYLPKNATIKTADIETDTGDIHLKKCHIQSGEVDSDYGEVTLDGCTFNNLKIESEAGNVQVLDEKAKLQALNLQLQTETGYLSLDDSLSVSKSTGHHHDADDHDDHDDYDDHDDDYDDADDIEMYYTQKGSGGKLIVETDSGEIILSCN